MSNPPAAFVWHDLMTTDVAAAKAFYAQVIGWKMEAFPGDHAYTVLSAGGVGMGGIMAMPADVCALGVPPHWQGYLGVDDVDAYARRVQASGGSLRCSPADIPGVGRFAMAVDPQGAGFILFKPASTEAMPAAAPGTPGLVGWNELYAGDGPTAFDWYAQLFGWTVVQDMDMGAMGIYRLFATGGAAVGGIMTRPSQVPVPCWGYYFNVDGLGAAMARVNQAGGQVLNGPMEVPGPMWVANCQDPQGAGFSMVSATP